VLSALAGCASSAYDEPPEYATADGNPDGAEPPQAPPANAPEPTTAPPMPSAAPPIPSDPGQVITPPQQPVAAAGPADAPPPPAQGTGQWVYTSQYGWLWMPYSRDYVYVSADSGVAYEYSYYPNYGWRWVNAPWILGWGPSPYWGRVGPVRYGWYAHPWFRVGYVHRGYYRGGYYRGGGYRHYRR
jgi:hypothetical protein